MPDNKTLTPAEQENLDRQSIHGPEIPGRPAAEIKETGAETMEAGAVRETESGPGEEVTAEPAAVPVKYAKLAPRPEPKPEQLRQIENILSENLKEAFLEMSPQKQMEFKREGERVASIIYQMIYSAKIQVKKIVELISGWLKRLPGVNKYFIEQESKIKADKIINLTKHDGP